MVHHRHSHCRQGQPGSAWCTITTLTVDKVSQGLHGAPSPLSLSTRSARVCMVHHQLDPPLIGAGYQWCKLDWCWLPVVQLKLDWCWLPMVHCKLDWCWLPMVHLQLDWCQLPVVHHALDPAQTGANYQWWTWWRAHLYDSYWPVLPCISDTISHWPVLFSTSATITIISLYCPVHLSQSLACTVLYICHNHWPVLSSTSATTTGLYCPVHLPQPLACTAQYICHNH